MATAAVAVTAYAGWKYIDDWKNEARQQKQSAERQLNEDLLQVCADAAQAAQKRLCPSSMNPFSLSMQDARDGLSAVNTQQSELATAAALRIKPVVLQLRQLAAKYMPRRSTDAEQRQTHYLEACVVTLLLGFINIK